MKFTKYALEHLVYIGTETKDLWFSVTHVLCFLSYLFPPISGSPLAHSCQKESSKNKIFQHLNRVAMCEGLTFWSKCSEIIIRHLGLVWLVHCQGE